MSVEDKVVSADDKRERLVLEVKGDPVLDPRLDGTGVGDEPFEVDIGVFERDLNGSGDIAASQ
jgi:hypothetical protein